MQSLLVVYDDSSAVYHPGSRVSGTVEIVVEKKFKIEAIKLEICGEGRSFFTQSEQRRMINKKGQNDYYNVTHNYDERITYIDDTLLLWTPSNGSKFLDEGNHSIPFTFVLPPKCAPSYEGTFGYIRYYCKVKLDIPWRFDKKSKTAFTVMPIYNLSLNPEASYSAHAETTENIGFTFIKHGYVTFKASMDKRGYVAGEQLNVIAWISNASSKIIQKICLRIKQLSKYTAYSASAGRTGTTNEVRTVFALDQDISLQPHKTETFQLITPVPVLPPTFTDCPIISVGYELHVKIYTKGNLKHTLKVILPFIVGTEARSTEKFQKPPVPPLPMPQSLPPTYGLSMAPPNNCMPPQVQMPTPFRPSEQPPIPTAPPAEPSMLTPEPPPSYQQTVIGFNIPGLQSADTNLPYKC